MASSSHCATFPSQVVPINSARDRCDIDQRELVIVSVDSEELASFPSEIPHEGRSIAPIAATAAAAARVRTLPSLPRFRIKWRIRPAIVATLAVLTLVAPPFWVRDRSLPTADRERQWTALVAPLDPQLVTANPVAQRDIQQRLNVYRDALGILDADAVVAVWPLVDEVTLRDRFTTLRDQNLDYDYCEIAATSTSATAVCRGELTTLGNARPRRRSWHPREWHFKLRKQTDAWTISRVEVFERGARVAALY